MDEGFQANGSWKGEEKREVMDDEPHNDCDVSTKDFDTSCKIYWEWKWSILQCQSNTEGHWSAKNQLCEDWWRWHINDCSLSNIFTYQPQLYKLQYKNQQDPYTRWGKLSLGGITGRLWIKIQNIHELITKNQGGKRGITPIEKHFVLKLHV